MSRMIGLDLGGTNIKAVLVEVRPGGPAVVDTMTTPTHAHLGPEAVISRIAAAARAVAPAGGTGLHEVGLTVPGAFDAPSGTVRLLPNLPGWENVRLTDILGSTLGVAVSLVNDSQAFTLAEGLLGAGRGSRVLAGLTLGTGIGGGILIDGALHTGPSGTAGEFGHQTIASDGPVCGCGRQGCLEALARPPAIAAAAGHADFASAVAAYRAGDDRAVAAIRSMIDYLSIGVANIMTMLGPDRVVIGGGAAQAADVIVYPIAEAAVRLAPLVDPDAMSIVGAELGPAAGAIGAALFVAAR